MGNILTYIGIILIAFGTLLMHWGNNIKSNEYKKYISSLMAEQTKHIKVNQIDITKEIVANESDLTLIIGNLTKMEKWFLSFFVRNPTTLNEDGALTRSLPDFSNEIKSEFAMGKNPYQMCLDSLVIKGLILWNNESMEVTFTPLGNQVILVLLRTKIYPFNFDNKYLLNRWKQNNETGHQN